MELDTLLKKCGMDEVAKTLNLTFENVKTNEEQTIEVSLTDIFQVKNIEVNKLVDDKLKQTFEDACDEYAKRLCEKYEWYFEDCFWVADIKGGTFCTSDIEYSLSMEDIKLLVDNDISFEEFDRWWYYNYRMGMAKMNNPQDETLLEVNLWTWIRGYHGDKEEEWLKGQEDLYWTKTQHGDE